MISAVRFSIFFHYFEKLTKKCELYIDYPFNITRNDCIAYGLEYFHGFITKQFNDLLPVGLLAQLVRALHPYHRGQEFESQYKPELFSGFLFATAKVASTTAMILFHVIDFFFIINNFGASYLEVVIIQRSKFKLLLLNSQ